MNGIIGFKDKTMGFEAKDTSIDIKSLITVI